MTDVDDKKSTVDRATVTWRSVVLGALAVIASGGSFIGIKVWEKVDKTNDSTIRQEETLRNIVAYHIPNMASSFNSRFDAQAARLDDNSKRIGKLEDWRLTLPIRGNP